MNYKIKVYYEDTDASGRVYHSNYLKYLERGRSEFLYKLGYNHQNLLQSLNFYFVVKHIDIDFKLPAYFEDILDVCLLYTSPSPRDLAVSRMPSSA